MNLERNVRVRLWDKKRKVMLKDTASRSYAIGDGVIVALEYKPSGGMWHFYRATLLNADDYEVMREIGRRDIENKMIFEDDIIEVENLGDQWIRGLAGIGTAYADYWAGNIRTIGNIYEHPNLLKSRSEEKV